MANKYEDRKMADMLKSRRFMTLLISTTVSLFLLAMPQFETYKEQIIDILGLVWPMIVIAFGAEDALEALAKVFYAVWDKADKLIDEE